MIKQDFSELSDEQIIENIDLIDEYYQKNLNYEILLAAEEKENTPQSRASSVIDLVISDEDYNDAYKRLCTLYKSGKIFHVSTIKKAGEDSEKIADQYFPKLKDQTSNRHDAMRHLMWNVLLAKNYFTLSSSRSSRVEFAKTVTNANESCNRVNSPDSEAMDLHNNAIGRDIYWDNTKVKRKWYGWPYVSEASTQTYTNDALDRIQNNSCFIVKEYNGEFYPEKELKSKENNKSPEEIQQLIEDTEDDIVVYYKGPVANGLEKDIVTDKYDYTICEEEGVAKPWKETRFYEISRSHPFFRYFIKSKYYDFEEDVIKIPYIWYAPCAEFMNVKCFKL